MDKVLEDMVEIFGEMSPEARKITGMVIVLITPIVESMEMRDRRLFAQCLSRLFTEAARISDVSRN